MPPFKVPPTFLFRRFGSRSVSSTASSRTWSVPFTVDRISAIKAFDAHHTKSLLYRDPSFFTMPHPYPAFLPYYIFSGTANIEFFAHFEKTIEETRYNTSGESTKSSHTRKHSIQHALTKENYDSTYMPLHIYASYQQYPCWIYVDT